MKQIVRWWLAVMLLLLGSASALAFTDTEGLDATELAAIEALSDMGVIEGYPDGSFRPDEPVSRAEFAKMLCTFAIQEQAAANTTFTDVPEQAWYAGWAALAAQQGWMNGYPGGEFRPQAQISQQELAAVLLRLSGMDTTELIWPDGYIAVAEESGLLEGVDFVGSAAASRLQTCRMMYALLPQQDEQQQEDEQQEDEQESQPLADGLYLGVVENSSSSDNSTEIAFYNMDYQLPLAASMRRTPTSGLFIYFTVQQGYIDDWHTLLDTTKSYVSASTPLTRLTVPDGPYSWARRQSGKEISDPAEFNAVKPLVQYISYRNLTVGQSRLDSRNYWLRDDTQIFEVTDQGQIQPGSRDSLALNQTVIVLADTNGEARYVFCYISADPAAE